MPRSISTRLWFEPEEDFEEEEIVRVLKTKLPRIEPLPWVTPVGIEMTWLVKGMRTKYWNGQNSATWDTERSFEAELIDRKIPYNNCSVDGHCIEVSTQVLNSREEVHYIRLAYEEIAKELKLVTNSPYVVSGGGHIHAGPLTKLEHMMLLRDMVNRPYVGWCFNDPSDVETADSMMRYFDRPDIRKLKVLSNKNAFERVASWSGDFGRHRARALLLPLGWRKQGVDCRLQSSDFPQDKELAIRWASGQKTTEFRFFGAAKDVNQQLEHVDFVQAYVGWIRDRIGNMDFPTVDLKKVTQPAKKLTYEECKREFLELIVKIGLQPAKYLKYANGNMKQRFQWPECLV